MTRGASLALCQRLDRYVGGNEIAFTIVRVPTEEEEGERAMSRQRQQSVRERQRLAAMGSSLLAMQNLHFTGRWSRQSARKKVLSLNGVPDSPVVRLVPASSVSEVQRLGSPTR